MRVYRPTRIGAAWARHGLFRMLGQSDGICHFDGDAFCELALKSPPGFLFLEPIEKNFSPVEDFHEALPENGHCDCLRRPLLLNFAA